MDLNIALFAGRRYRARSSEREGSQGAAHHRHLCASGTSRRRLSRGPCLTSRTTTNNAAATPAKRRQAADDAQLAKERPDDAVEVRQPKTPVPILGKKKKKKAAHTHNASLDLRENRTDDKIAQMEAKLLQLAQAPPTGTQPPAPLHPSLPAKPGTHSQSTAPAVNAAPPIATPRIKPPLPRVARPPSPPTVTSSALRAAPSSRKSNAGLKGVKFVRKKDKPKVEGAGEGSS
jgi:hypothetical protein